MATKNDVKRRLLALFMAFVMAFSLLPVSALADSDPVVELIVGEEKALPGVRESDNGQHEWSVENEDIVSVEDGYVTGLRAGETGIVKKTAHPTCPVMPPVLVLTATVSA